MERRIPLICLFILVFASLVHPQELKQEQNIQLYLWAELDAYPENYANEKQEHPNDDLYSYPIRRIKQLTPYLLSGMVYGWNFVYTPYDKTRRVAEYFENTEIKSFEDNSKNIIYKKPIITDGKLAVWIEFERNSSMISYLNYWHTPGHTKIRGSGKAPLQNGFDGIKEACDEALKNAVREYFRTQIKNKPKEIVGKVLIKSIPRLSVESNQYVVDLDFFVETVRITSYSQF